MELPSVGVLKTMDPVLSGFKPPTLAHSRHEPDSDGSRPMKPVPGTGVLSHISTAGSPVRDAEEELDLLLGLQKPVTSLSLAKTKTSKTIDVPATSEEGQCLQ